MTETNIAIVDMDYFFAQCEVIRKPELKDKPIAVCMFSGRTDESGAVASANYRARRSGVKAGMSIYHAKEICPDCTFIKADMDYYRSVSNNIMHALRSKFSAIEEASIDEAYIDITSLGEPKNIAKEIKQLIQETSRLTCTVGIGPNKLVAKIASDMAKPDGLLIVATSQIDDFLNPLPVERIPYIGLKTKEALNKAEITTVTEARSLSLERLRTLFGRKHGEFMYNAFRGVDLRAVSERPPHKQIGRIRSLREGGELYAELDDKVKRIATDIIKRISKSEGAFQSITALVIFEDFSYKTKARTLPLPASSADLLFKEGLSMIKEIVAENKKKEVRRVGLSVGRSKMIKEAQMDQFL